MSQRGERPNETAPSLPGGRLAAVALAVALAATACGNAGAATPTTTADAATTEATTTDVSFFDDSTVHEISVTFDTGDYDAMIETFSATGEKDWIEATVAIDGVTYEQAGIRLKGNSSLMGLRNDRSGVPGGAADDEPEALPWLIRLDKYVDGQSHDGITDFVVRSNTTETSLNEAVAVGLLEMAGLASQDAVAVRFSVNGSDETLRLVLEHPDDLWMTQRLSADGALYKAESTGDYTYRGDDPDAYDEVFDQEAGKDNADLTPLIEFLQWLDESDDAAFAAELPERLDVDAFATYLAMQQLIDNFDDIDGPGNNSYLYWDAATGRFTVVPWDHNMAFGVGPGAEGGPGAADGAAGPPGQGDRPGRTGGAAQDGQPTVDARGGNVLSERFLSIGEYADLVDQRAAELRAALYDSGEATVVLDAWVSLLTTQVSDLVDPATVAAEAAVIRAIIDGA